MENTIILDILADHLHGRKTTLPADTDMAALAELAKRHQVDGIVYRQCGMPPIPSMAEAYSAAAYFYANRTRMMAQIAAAMKQRQIPYCTVKGLNIAKFYPVPALRTMVDCDIAVPPGHMSDAVEALHLLGFTTIEDLGHEWNGQKSGVHFEVHDELVRDNELFSDENRAFFNDFMSYVTDGELDRSFHFLFLLAHLRKHLIGFGAGIRQFFDLAVLLKNDGPFDFDWISEKLRELQMQKFSGLCFDLLRRWFDVTVPLDFEPLSDDEADRATAIILQNGVFGEFEDKVLQKSQYVLEKGPRWLRNLRVFLRAVFLPYRELRQYPGITYLDGKPWLLPVAWVHRLFLLLRRKDTAKTRETLEQSTISKEEHQKRKEYLKDLGIK